MKTGNLPRPEVDALLARMRAMRAEAGAGALGTRSIGEGRGSEFRSVMRDAVGTADTGMLPGLLSQRSATEALSDQAVGAAQGTRATGPVARFQSVFAHALDQVNALGHAAGDARASYLKGEGTSLVDATIAANKADVAFQAVTQVRNRLVSAYEDIMNMPI